MFEEISFEEKHRIVAHWWGKNGLEKFHQMRNACVYDDLEVKDLFMLQVPIDKAHRLSRYTSADASVKP